MNEAIIKKVAQIERRLDNLIFPEAGAGGVLPAVAAVGYALVSDGVNSWAADQTPAWTGEHSFVAGIAFTGASGANEITIPDNTAIALELLDAGGLEYARIVSTDANPYFLIDPAAAGINVGIGTADPGLPLRVAIPFAKTDTTERNAVFFGSNEATAANPAGILITVDGAAAQADRSVLLQTQEWGVGNEGNLCLQPYGGQVSVGHTAPGYLLDVQDDVVGYVGNFFNDGNNANREGIKIQCCEDANPTGFWAIFLDGNGDTCGGAKGDGAGGTSYWSASDEGLKNILGPIDQGLAMEALVNVNPIQYVGKGLTAKTGRKNVGFSAQDIHKYFPEVATNDGISYERLVPVLWAQNKALLARLEAGGL